MTEFLVDALRGPRFPAVRRRVFRQLVESLVYEGALTPRALDGDRLALDGPGVRYEFRATRRFTFGRPRMTADPVLRVTDVGAAEAESPALFLDELRHELHADPASLANFARELEETLLKDALAQHARTPGNDDVTTAGYDELEGAVTDGHLYHPVYKSRIGFDPDDNLAYGPEFARPVRPLWIAVHRSIAHVATSRTLTEQEFLRAQLGEFHARLDDPDAYTMLPVHPWQWREIIARTFAARLRDGELVVLGEDPREHLAQQSIRTLACRDEPGRAYLKLALSIVNTSTSRVLAPHTVRNAPVISDWLRDVLAGDAYLHDRLRTILLGEVHAVSVDPPDSPLLREDGYGALACIWRDSLPGHLDDDERAVPFTALTARDLNGVPLIDPWVRGRGVSVWLRELLRVSILPVVHMLRYHGIALEAHAQNMILVHRDGWPSRVALRDFHDGVRFCRSALREPGRCPPLLGTPEHHVNRNSFVETEDAGLVADFVLDAFFFINLGELALFLADAYDVAEPEFWALAGDVLAEHERRFPGLPGAFDVRKPEFQVEQLTLRRLLPDTELRLHSVPNPLAG